MFFQQAKKGNNEIGAYLLTFIVTFILGYSFFGILPLSYQLLKDSGKLKELQNATSPDVKSEVIDSVFTMLSNTLEYANILGSRNEAFFFIMLMFAITALFFVFSLYVFHKKKLIWVITGSEKFRWNLFANGILVSSIVVVFTLLFMLIFSPEDLIFQFQWKTFIPLLILSLLMIPIQAGWEEAFFRGWMMQGFGLLFKNRGWALLLTTLIFALVHLANPEVAEHGVAVMLPIYFTISLSFGIMVLMSDGLELSMGFHIANNIMLSLFITSPEAVLQTDAVFRMADVQDYSGQLFSVIFANAVVLAIFAFQYKWTDWTTKLFGPIN